MNAPPVLGLRRRRLPLPAAAEGEAGLPIRWAAEFGSPPSPTPRIRRPSGRAPAMRLDG
jgi:hypothetical protein